MIQTGTQSAGAGETYLIDSKALMVIGVRSLTLISITSTMPQDPISRERMTMTLELEETASLNSDLRRVGLII